MCVFVYVCDKKINERIIDPFSATLSRLPLHRLSSVSSRNPFSSSHRHTLDGGGCWCWLRENPVVVVFVTFSDTQIISSSHWVLSVHMCRNAIQMVKKRHVPFSWNRKPFWFGLQSRFQPIQFEFRVLSATLRRWCIEC